MDLKKDTQTKLLLDTIRKELNSIINDSESQTKSLPEPTNNSTQRTSPDVADKSKNEAGGSISNLFHNTTRKLRFKSDIDNNKSGIDSVLLKNAASEEIKSTELLSDEEITKRAALLDRQSSQSIDEDLQKMRIDLKQSYELFQTIGDKFEAINFGQLKNRIKDLHLSNKNNEAGKAATVDLNDLFQQSYVDNRIDKLTGEMGEKFRKHPGEFGDIPELSAFFKACTQLQHGLEQLKRQRNEANDLSKRMCWAAESSYDRIDELRKTLGEDLTQKPRGRDSI